MSEIRVLKFGGSSLASAELIHKVAEIVESHYRASEKVVVVVSAMGKSTDGLLKLAEEVSPNSKIKHRRELDMLVSVGERISMSLLSMAIRDHGIEALSLTGSQSGIITTETHGEAEIVEIRGERILKALEEKKVVIVAGFQGISTAKEITTLGRGGSDTTALALASFLKAKCAHIYSDVDAYYSADPKVVNGTLRYDELPWELGVLSSFYGAKVLHHKAAELAAQNQTEIHLLSTFNPQGKRGYLRGGVTSKLEQFQVFTLNLKKGLQKLTTKNQSGLDKKNQPELEGLISPLFCDISKTSTEPVGIEANVSKIFTYFDENFAGHQGGPEKISSDSTEYWCLTLVGTGLHKKPSLLSEAKAALSKQGIQIEASHWNPLALSLYFKAQPQENQLLQSFHDTFITKK